MKLQSTSSAFALAFVIAATFAGCAEVRQVPADAVVNGQDNATSQVADVPPPRQSSVPF
jgi:hypothetical protein